MMMAAHVWTHTRAPATGKPALSCKQLYALIGKATLVSLVRVHESKVHESNMCGGEWRDKLR